MRTKTFNIIDWISIILLVFLGLILIVVELVLIPGTTVAGIIGAILLVAGIYLSFSRFGNQVGFLITVGASISLVALLYYVFKSGTLKRFSLKGAITSKVNEHLLDNIKVGDIGLTTSALRPMGKAQFNDREYEVTSNGFYIEPDTKIKILKILTSNKIVVEPI